MDINGNISESERANTLIAFGGSQYFEMAISDVKATKYVKRAGMYDDGFAAVGSDVNYAIIKHSSEYIAKMRGKQEYLSANGQHGIRVTDSGVQKLVSGSWVSI